PLSTLELVSCVLIPDPPRAACSSFSLRDALPISRTEKTYSAPLATHLFAKESRADGQGRDFPRLKFGGSHLDDAGERDADALQRGLSGLAGGGMLWLALFVVVRQWLRPCASWFAWDALLWAMGAMLLIGGVLLALMPHYHVLGTDKVGQDVLYLTLKSIRTALLIGTLTTLSMLPAALLLGIVAGYKGGWIDDVIQYIYTVLNSIPGVLLIAASILMMQVVIDTHPEWFSTA